MLGQQKQAVERGKQLLNQAEQKLNSFSLFNTTQKIIDSSELFIKAGYSFKLGQKWKDAAECFVKSAECYQKCNNTVETISYCIEAANCFKKCYMNREALQAYQVALPLQIENGKIYLAGQLYEEIAKIFEEEKRITAACNEYENASKCYQLEHRTSLSSNCLLKVAELKIFLKDYKSAISIYEEIGMYYLKDNLLKNKSKKLFFKAILCQWIEECPNGLCDITRKQLDQYSTFFPSFASSKYCHYLFQLLDSCEERNYEEFQKILIEYQHFPPLDNIEISLLLELQEFLKPFIS